MRILSINNLRDFWLAPGREDCKTQLSVWIQLMRLANFQNLNQVKASWPAADVIAGNRIIFNICGNKYRLIASFNIGRQTVFVKFIGTHAAYDRIDPVTVNLFPPQ
jgi:mRNA interferase HigB